jgi:hypothetical protein
VSAESLGFGRTSVENERMTYIRGRALDSGQDDARTSYLHLEGSDRRSPRMRQKEAKNVKKATISELVTGSFCTIDAVIRVRTASLTVNTST